MRDVSVVVTDLELRHLVDPNPWQVGVDDDTVQRHIWTKAGLGDAPIPPGGTVERWYDPERMATTYRLRWPA